jgi:hypothetical protein
LIVMMITNDQESYRFIRSIGNSYINFGKGGDACCCWDLGCVNHF